MNTKSSHDVIFKMKSQLGQDTVMNRILLVTNDFIPMVGGVSNHIDALATALSKQGFIVVVMHICYTNLGPLEETRSGYKVIRVVVARTLADETSLHKKLSRHWLNFSVGRQHLRQIYSKFQPDVIHWHDYYHSGLITKNIGANKPAMICTNHASRYLEQYAKGPILQRYLRFFASHADGIIAPSEELAQKSLISGKPTKFIPNGVDETRFKPTDKYRESCCKRFGIDPQAKIILAPRRVDPKNGLMTLINAVPHINLGSSKFSVLIAGGGPDELVHHYREEAKRLGVDHLITITGVLPSDFMPRLVPSADVVVIPSFYEAVSLAALEALSCGVPVVASDVGGLPYVINSNNGILVPPGDPAALAAALSQLLANETSRLEKGHNGRQLVLKKFTWDKVAKDTATFYSEFI